MARISTLFTGLLLLAGSALGQQTSWPATAVSGIVGRRPASTGTSYNYKEDKGPSVWHTLDAAWEICQSGQEQSPINIVQGNAIQGVQTPIVFNYAPTPIQCVNTGKTLQFFGMEGNSIQIANRTFNLIQIHFHHSSEHTFNGGSFPAELHFVHADADGALAVIGVMFTTGGENPAFPINVRLDQVLPDSEGVAYSLLSMDLNLNALLPESKQYYHYMGSLTTPPCSEGVAWHVMANPVTLSEEEMSILLKGLQNLKSASETGTSHRPVQPINGRQIFIGQSPAGIPVPATSNPITPSTPQQVEGTLDLGAISTDRQYDYKMGPNGPGNWTSFNEACGGEKQSPIDIVESSVQAGLTTEIKFSADWGSANIQAINTGKTIQFGLPEAGSIQIGGITYNLLQAHLHATSEHTFNGGSFPMEIHFVHQASDGTLAVLGVMLVEGAVNDAFANARELYQNIPKTYGVTHSFQAPTGNLLSLIPDDRTFYHYSGSLTTPPCSEGVMWHVFRQPVTMSKEQISIFLTALNSLKYASETGTSNRPVQPLNERTVYSGYPFPAPDNGVVSNVTAIDLPENISGSLALAPASNSVKYDYGPDKGPEKWGSLDASYELCDTGLEQSPIDIDVKTVVQGVSTPIVRDYSPTSLTVKNNGKNIEFTLADNGNTMQIGDRTFNLLQMHMHTLSEHTFNGGFYPVEMHFVHADADGNLAVLGVMVQEGAENPAFPKAERLAQLLPDNEGVDYKFGEDIVLDALFPANRQYYHYMGSLTTPPCSQNVAWHVFTDPVELSADQLKVFVDHLENAAAARAARKSNRPVQPLNGRTVYLGQSFEGLPEITPQEAAAPAATSVEILTGDLVLDPPTDLVWDYKEEGERGPSSWHTLDAAWDVCLNGLEQSPINIVEGAAMAGILSPIEMSYGETKIDILNNGKTIEFDSVAANTVTIRGVSYSMVNIHLHHTSEHVFNGGSYVAEIHFVHADADGNLAVLGVMVEEGEANSGFPSDLRQLEQMIPEGTGVHHKISNLTINPALMFPESKDYYHYKGSLTTPPCSEGVLWHVFRNPITLSRQQIEIIISAMRGLEAASSFGNTNRPVQPLNARSVTLGYPIAPAPEGSESVDAQYIFPFTYFSVSTSAQEQFINSFVEQLAYGLGVSTDGISITNLQKNDPHGVIVTAKVVPPFETSQEVFNLITSLENSVFSAGQGWNVQEYGEATNDVQSLSVETKSDDDDDESGLSDSVVATIVVLVIMFTIIIIANGLLWCCLMKKSDEKQIVYYNEKSSVMSRRKSLGNLEGKSMGKDNQITEP